MQQVERRVDPEDGESYTQAEFVAQYGGTAEWDAAGARMQQQQLMQQQQAQQRMMQQQQAQMQQQQMMQQQQQAQMQQQMAAMSAGAPERRTDPDDGQPYTRAEFIEQYGGTAEWDAAHRSGAAAGERERQPTHQP